MDEYIAETECRRGLRVFCRSPEIPHIILHSGDLIFDKIGYDENLIRTFLSPEKLWVRWIPAMMVRCITNSYHPEFLRILFAQQIPGRTFAGEVVVEYSKSEIAIAVVASKTQASIYAGQILWLLRITCKDERFKLFPRADELRKIYGIKDVGGNSCVIKSI